MDRKGILGIALAVIGLICWQIYYTKASQQALRAQREAEAIAAANAPAVAPSPEPAPAIPNAVAPSPAVEPKAPAEPTVPPTIETLATATVEYSFTNLGAGISRARLTEHAAEHEGKVVLNEFSSIPIGAVADVAGEATDAPFTMTKGDNAIVFDRSDARQLQTTKKFILPKLDGLDAKARLREEYLLRLEMTFTNRGAAALSLPAYFIHTGSAAPLHQNDQPIYTGFNWFNGSKNHFTDVAWFAGGGFAMFKKPPRPVYTESQDGVHWAGVTNQYFASIITPLVDEKANTEAQQQQRGSNVWARRHVVSDDAWKEAGHTLVGAATERWAVDGAIGMRGITLEPGQSVTQSFAIYAGPREYRRLSVLGQNEAEVMDFGIFGIVSKTLLNSMNLLRSWFNSYAWAIVVLTLCIKTLMWPLQNKATTSMKRMQLLQPKMTELREKYKDDPTRMNTEIMRLYKDYKINPMSGCLPMLVQIPIFFGFYSMLGKAVELRNSTFFWVKDLSQPDTIAHLLGIPINPLPMLMAGTMFWQMAISPKSGDPVQQRVFMFMPLIFIFFCYNFASALALYWTVQNLFSVAQLYATRNQAPPTLQKAAAPAGKKKPRG